MYLKKLDTPRVVTLPDGGTLSVADLPDPRTQRWYAGRKALVVQAVQYGLIHAEEAQRRYRLSREELESWIAASSDEGANGLKMARVQARRRG